jgi:hypothetical protein
VLQIISRSPTEVTPVYQAIADAATRVLDAPGVFVLLVEGDELVIAARSSSATVPGAPRLMRVGDRHSISAMDRMDTVALGERRTVHVPDIEELDDQIYGGLKGRMRSVGVRTLLAAPIWRGAEPLGSSASAEAAHVLSAKRRSRSPRPSRPRLSSRWRTRGCSTT